ncbi:amino acid ABC transporter substrate-binding protein [Coriobacteriaceae bacterium]|nr:amino acid ABC transporter substrate-binding protein [Coriobacteriaceae bacterium]
MGEPVRHGHRRPTPRTALCVLVILAGTLLCGCAALQGPFAKRNIERDLSTVEPGTLTVACDFASPPMDFVDSDGQRRGFEYELVAEVADRLGLDLEFRRCEDLPAVESAVADRAADMAASALSLDDFGGSVSSLEAGSPYMSVGRDVVVPRERPFKGVEQLNDPACTVVVQGGSPNEAWVRETLPKAAVVPVDNAVQGLTGVANGTYSAAVYDDVSATYLLNSMFGTLMVGHHQDDVSRYCFAFSSEDPAVREAVDDALAALEEDGFVASLEAKWFGSPLA